MNREIAFRVWDGRIKNWIHLPGDEVNLFGESILLGSFMYGTSLDDLNYCQALQNSGLNDKDGYEIYEGDILNIQTEDNPEDLQWELGVVEFLNGCFWLGGKFNQPLYELLSNNVIDGKIIGNIFDNPELLKL